METVNKNARLGILFTEDESTKLLELARITQDSPHNILASAIQLMYTVRSDTNGG